jgi:hypothetical protein
MDLLDKYLATDAPHSDVEESLEKVAGIDLPGMTPMVNKNPQTMVPKRPNPNVMPRGKNLAALAKKTPTGQRVAGMNKPGYRPKASGAATPMSMGAVGSTVIGGAMGAAGQQLKKIPAVNRIKKDWDTSSAGKAVSRGASAVGNAVAPTINRAGKALNKIAPPGSPQRMVGGEVAGMVSLSGGGLGSMSRQVAKNSLRGTTTSMGARAAKAVTAPIRAQKRVAGAVNKTTEGIYDRAAGAVKNVGASATNAASRMANNMKGPQLAHATARVGGNQTRRPMSAIGKPNANAFNPGKAGATAAPVGAAWASNMDRQDKNFVNKVEGISPGFRKKVRQARGRKNVASLAKEHGTYDTKGKTDEQVINQAFSPAGDRDTKVTRLAAGHGKENASLDMRGNPKAAGNANEAVRLFRGENRRSRGGSFTPTEIKAERKKTKMNSEVGAEFIRQRNATAKAHGATPEMLAAEAKQQRKIQKTHNRQQARDRLNAGPAMRGDARQKAYAALGTGRHLAKEGPGFATAPAPSFNPEIQKGWSAQGSNKTPFVFKGVTGDPKSTMSKKDRLFFTRRPDVAAGYANSPSAVDLNQSGRPGVGEVRAYRRKKLRMDGETQHLASTDMADRLKRMDGSGHNMRGARSGLKAEYPARTHSGGIAKTQPRYEMVARDNKGGAEVGRYETRMARDKKGDPVFQYSTKSGVPADQALKGSMSGKTQSSRPPTRAGQAAKSKRLREMQTRKRVNPQNPRYHRGSSAKGADPNMRKASTPLAKLPSRFDTQKERKHALVREALAKRNVDKQKANYDKGSRKLRNLAVGTAAGGAGAAYAASKLKPEEKKRKPIKK